MRPLENLTSDSVFTEQEVNQIDTSTPIPQVSNQRAPQQLEPIKVLKSFSSKSSHKTFLVRSRIEGQHNIARETWNHQETDLENTEVQAQTQISMIEPPVGGDSNSLKVVKVYDNSDSKSLNELSHELSIMRKLVGIDSNTIQNFGAANINSETAAFVDEQFQVHQYPQGYTILVQEYCKNADLLSFVLNEGNQKQQAECLNQSLLIRKIIRQLVKTIDQFHCKLNMSLLNLKPSKILLDQSLGPKFYDFRSCTSNMYSRINREMFKIDQLEQSDLIYLAPEVINANHNSELRGDKIDMFSLGAMLFVCLFKQAPFKTASPRDSFYKYIHSNKFSLQEKFFQFHPATKGLYIDSDLKRLLISLLAYDPQQRPTASEVLENTWFKKEETQLNSVHQQSKTQQESQLQQQQLQQQQ
ncbi:protein kinase domain containing protein [Stylonychia lemnae]|uniref:Protein kinase domain containing protein n=1 Tax=Stylonychia lemnae TaxID=5949 RepID=A0A078B6U0_STYLE|nr:protein kinase domain containing protein [Stylonychia lemnae]|eukprot:CDW89901.1 protein kinase domain containing protein [Stylonychia lemnae]